MPYEAIDSRWASGSLIFHEKGNYGDAANLLTLGTTGLTVGNASQDCDFTIYLGAADQYVKFDAGAATVTFAKVDVAISADVTVTLEDISVTQGKFIFLDGQDGGEYIYSKTADYLNLNGTTGIDLMIGGTEEVRLVANSLQPYASDGCALGTGSYMWSDLFLANAGVINFNNGDVTVTHGSHSLTFDACAVIFNEASADYDWRVESNGIAYALFVDGGKDSVVIGSNTDTSSVDQLVNITRAARTATAATPYYDLKITPAGAVTVPTGTTALVAEVRIDEPNITATGSVTEAATLYIGGAPTEGGANYALHIAGGATLLAGSLTMGASGATAGDFVWYGTTAAYVVTFDADGDTNGSVLVGADTKGILFSLYGDTTGCGVFWNPSTDTNGALVVGGSGGSKGNDVLLYGATNGAYGHWDQSANALLLVGDSRIDFSSCTVAAASTDGGLIKGGASGSPIVEDTADMKFISFYLDDGATSGTARGIYVKLDVTGTGGSGDAARLYCSQQSAGVNARGAHISLDFGASGTVSGSGQALTTTLHIPDTASQTGWLSAITGEIYTEGSTSDPAGSVLSVCRFSNLGSAKDDVDDDAAAFYWDNGWTSATGNMIYEHTVATPGAAAGSIKIRLPSGGAGYLYYWGTEGATS